MAKSTDRPSIRLVPKAVTAGPMSKKTSQPLEPVQFEAPPWLFMMSGLGAVAVFVVGIFWLLPVSAFHTPNRHCGRSSYASILSFSCLGQSLIPKPVLPH